MTIEACFICGGLCEAKEGHPALMGCICATCRQFCPRCGGSGLEIPEHDNEPPEVCRRCKGDGRWHG